MSLFIVSVMFLSLKKKDYLYLLEKQSETERELNLPSSGTLPQCSQQPGLGHVSHVGGKNPAT